MRITVCWEEIYWNYWIKGSSNTSFTCMQFTLFFITMLLMWVLPCAFHKKNPPHKINISITVVDSKKIATCGKRIVCVVVRWKSIKQNDRIFHYRSCLTVIVAASWFIFAQIRFVNKVIGFYRHFHFLTSSSFFHHKKIIKKS
jgi:hypothetical protein